MLEKSLQVETFGAMAKTEKIAFILEQVGDILLLFLMRILIIKYQFFLLQFSF